MTLHTPNLRTIRYIGDEPRQLWEAGLPEVPMMEKGDVAVVPLITAALLISKPEFEYFQDNTNKIAIDIKSKVTK